MQERCATVADQSCRQSDPQRIRRRIRHIDGRYNAFVPPLCLIVHHQHGEATPADHTLDGRANEDVEEKLLAVAPHDNEVGADRLSRLQNSIKGIARDYRGNALNFSKFRHGSDLLGEHSFGLFFFHADQFRLLIIIHDMDQMQL
jgi:hypothetical protein